MVFDGNRFAAFMVNTLAKFMTGLEALNVPPPFVVAVIVDNVRGHHIPQGGFGDLEKGFDRKTLFLPEVVVEERGQDAAQIIKPILDALWQSAGWQRCFQYAADGKSNIPRWE